MPVLPQEPFLFPDGLLDEAETDPDASARWWVLHTRPRAEKALARRLLSDSLAFFLPLHERQLRSSGRLLRSYLPLFPGYVFVHGDAQARLRALRTNLIANVIAVEDQKQLHADLGRVYRLITAGLPVGPEARLQPGTRVAITTGPLEGLEGKILRWGKRCKFFLEVQFLRQGVSVEIDEWMLEPLGSPGVPETVGASIR